MTGKTRPITLTIAGFDPIGGAGIIADLKSITACGGYGVSVITALTAQNTERVASVEAVSGEAITIALNTLLDDVRPDAIKIGMLPDRDAVSAVVDFLAGAGIDKLVFDPVFNASDGCRLFDAEARALVRSKLIPMVSLLTPNLAEAAVLSGSTIFTADDVRKAAENILRGQSAPKAVLIKGGHLEGEAIDILYDGREMMEFAAKRRPGRLRGTGCILSSAIAAGLAEDLPLRQAVSRAKTLVESIFDRARISPGAGADLFDLASLDFGSNDARR